MFRYLAIIFATILLAVPATAQRVTLAENTTMGADTFLGDQFFAGQSLVIARPAGTSYNNIQFSFLNGAANTNSSAGTLYIFSSAYTGRPNALAAAPGRIAAATASNNVFSFAPGITLQGGTTYYVYSDSLQILNDSRVSASTYSGGNVYVATSSSSNFVVDADNGDANFRLTGIAAAAPEPATWGLMILGFGLVGAVFRRRVSSVSGTFVV